jgi:hypothetical protein
MGGTPRRALPTFVGSAAAEFTDDGDLSAQRWRRISIVWNPTESFKALKSTQNAGIASSPLLQGALSTKWEAMLET